MNIRIYNARLLTMADGMNIIMGEVWVEGSRITYAGPNNPDCRKKVWDREIDADGNIVMPGFKNAHTHSAMTFLRSYADDLPLLDWLNQQVFPMEDKLRPEHIGTLTKLAVMEYLTSGITANLDMYFYPEEIAKAAVETGFRTVLQGAAGGEAESAVKMEADFLALRDMHELVTYQLGFHAEYTAEKGLLEAVAGLSEKYRMPVYTHNSESASEVEQCIARNGLTPTAYFENLGLFRYGGTLYHCVHMTDEDLDICKNRGISIVTNPASNTKLASGIPRIQDMMDRGINLAIGTDGPASNNCLDMFREMFLVTGLGKLKDRNAAAVDADRVLYMATVGGARAMGLKDCETLTAGSLADLIMIDLHQPNMQPMNKLTKNIVYSGSKLNVKLTMVNGKVLYEDGRFFIGADPEEIYAGANRIIRGMEE